MTTAEARTSAPAPQAETAPTRGPGSAPASPLRQALKGTTFAEGEAMLSANAKTEPGAPIEDKRILGQMLAEHFARMKTRLEDEIDKNATAERLRRIVEAEAAHARELIAKLETNISPPNKTRVLEVVDESLRDLLVAIAKNGGADKRAQSDEYLAIIDRYDQTARGVIAQMGR